MMRYKKFLFLLIFIFTINSPVFAYWVWSPGTGKWVNPKYAVKDTPEEQYEYAKSIFDSGGYKDALKEFKKLIKYYPLSKEAPRAQFHVGLCLEKLGQSYEAFQAYQKVIDNYPYTELVDEVIEREYKIGDMFFSGQKIRVLGVMRFPAKDKAIEILKQVAENAPYGKYAELAKYKAGLAYRDIMDYENAILTFKELLDKYPNSTLADDARFQLAQVSTLLSTKPAYDQTPTKEARKEFEKLLKEHPESEMAGEADRLVRQLKEKEAQSLWDIAQFYEKRGMPESAIIYYEDIAYNYKDTKLVDMALERINALKKK